MPAVDEVREALERTVPDYRDRSGDWESVLAQARAGERERRRWSRWPVVAVASVGTAIALALFWPAGGGGDSIIDRARAAVEGGPVIHAVLRQAPVEVYDLERDEYGSVPAVQEEWFNSDRGQLRTVWRVGSQVVGHIVGPSRPASASGAEQKFAGVATAYIRALDADKASLGPEETVEGQRVYWIRFRVEYSKSGPQSTRSQSTRRRSSPGSTVSMSASETYRWLRSARPGTRIRRRRGSSPGTAGRSSSATARASPAPCPWCWQTAAAMAWRRAAMRGRTSRRRARSRSGTGPASAS